MLPWSIQVRRGAYFLQEHPAEVASWSSQVVKTMTKLPGETVTKLDMCLYGMRVDTKEISGHARKAPKLMADSPEIASELQRRCLGYHEHVNLKGGLAGICVVYPDGLFSAVCRGLRAELDRDARVAGQVCSMP